MNESDAIASPLVEGSPAHLVDVVECEYIIRQYRKTYKIDVSAYFSGIDKTKIYECDATGYRFYYPYSLAGKESLYRQLSDTVDGRYKDDKWEYRKAISFIRPSARILDVGCGKGAFVMLAGNTGLRAHGLELNSASATEARDNGLSVSTEMIEEHAKTHRGFYDAVCAFQVLEHVPNVREFICDCLFALRPGGLLIFGVPNNDGFVGLDHNAVLNMPPHHMGLWTKRSLVALSDVFRLHLKSIEFEPLQEIDWYATVMERRWITNPALLSAYHRFGLAQLYRELVKQLAYRIAGHTILAVYEKRE